VVLASVFFAAITSAAKKPKEIMFSSEGMPVRLERIANLDDVIWGFDFLPGGQMAIATTRTGKVFSIDLKSGQATEIEGAPAVVAQSQGGLLDIRVSPDFEKTRLIYMTYSEPVKKLSTTALGRAELQGNKLVGFKKLFSAEPAVDGGIHYGSRIEFKDGFLFVTIGDRNERKFVQDLNSHIGKIVRLNMDGSVPKDNPFANQKNARAEIWSLGHRSPQGLALHPETQDLWQAEMGPRGGDEVNLIRRGANYGWPVITYGREYYGLSIGPPSREGMEQPLVHYVPSISPSAMTFYSAEALPKWRGNLFLACLSGSQIRRIVLDGQKVKTEEALLKDLGERFRGIRQGPDGALYFSTDSGLLARLVANTSK